MYYVYALTDPRKNDAFFYIGKGKGRRAKHHLHEFNNKTRSFKQAVIKAIRAEGMEPGIQYLHQFDDEEQAFAKEVELIALYGRRDMGLGPLTNQTNGGDGVRGHIRLEPRKHTDETKQRMSESHTGKDKPWLRSPKSKDTIERMSIARRARTGPGPTAGKKWNQEQRDRLSERRMGQSCPTKGKKRVYREDGTFYFAFPGNQSV